MKTKKCIYQLFFLLFPLLHIHNSIHARETRREAQASSIPQNILKSVKKGKIVVSADITQKKDRQHLIVYAYGLNTLSCRKTMRKLSKYEFYQNYLDFVKTSQYDNQKQEVFFILGLDIIPMKFLLRFIIPRIKGPGSYPFTFIKGIFPGLKGIITLIPQDKHCLFYLQAYWKGSPPKLSPFLLELFIETVIEKGMDRLFRLSKT